MMVGRLVPPVSGVESSTQGVLDGQSLEGMAIFIIQSVNLKLPLAIVIEPPL